MKPERYDVFNDMIEGVQVIDKDWKYVYVNNALIEQSKLTREQLLGYTMMERFPGIEQTEMFANLGNCLTNQVSHQMENEFRFPDGTIGYFELRMQPVPDGVLVMSFDITERKRLEHELRRLNDGLDELVKERTLELAEALDREMKLNELKSQFVSIASHEFKTPLGAIQISVNVLEEFNGPEHASRRSTYYTHIKSSVKHLFKTIDDFLSLDYIEQGIAPTNESEFDLDELTTREVNKMQLTCKQDQQIRYAFSGDSMVVLDEVVVTSILMNLLSNAIKYSDKDVKLQVTADENVQIHVVDQGIGIPEKEQQRLFDRFFRAKNARHTYGTGLGLNIVKRYVDMLEGKISFSSRPGEGTTFTVLLPNSQMKKKQLKEMA